MNDILLAKANLPPDFIDCCVGEPHLIRDNLYANFDISSLTPTVSNQNIFEYTKPNGFDPLVKFLEDKHQAPVIISNGAKQCVGSLLYALKKNNRLNIGLTLPFWSLFKPLIEMHGLNLRNSIYASDSFLLVHPNNPDGFVYDFNNLDSIVGTCKELSIPLIHDGAYYDQVYLGESYKLSPIGDVQIFTCSKLLGLSQLRVGYSVFYNTELYKAALEYMEHFTVGVSILSQIFALNIFKEMFYNPDITSSFKNMCYADLSRNRILANTINPEILELKKDSMGMFLWGKYKDFNKFHEAKISVIEGTPFGMPGYVRLNMAFDERKFKEIIKRLNSVK